ncbi:hypothetical protein QR680_017473 [Steinernema hermaphroditum]|uniref:Uncharacterized protein n=1 Tax=Steinernema hermaphroditum TaxID=289476 RepID=A0AA39HEP6_9BILA|nr:hypothetical protein QR680_017473 [Steinernema hermaphroditum]
MLRSLLFAFVLAFFGTSTVAADPEFFDSAPNVVAFVSMFVYWLLVAPIIVYSCASASEREPPPSSSSGSPVAKINGHASQRFWAPVARYDDDAGNSPLVTSQGPQKAAARARLVDKDGNCKLRQIHLPNRYKNLYKNWFHLIIESSWRCILAIFAAGFLASWATFAILYYTIVYLSGDLQKNAENRQCIANVHSFVSAFLFSLESQHTIGYGTRYMTEMCPPAFIVLCFQLIFGVLLQTMLAGIVIAKVLRPKKRKQEMKFSKFAVIGPTDDHDKRPALMIRVADIQDKLYLAESHVRLYMARTRANERNERELVGVKDMNVGYDSGLDRVLLLWPIIVRHVIDEESPLFGMRREDMMRGDFELIMTVEGIVEATGMTFQARTSFLPEEIQWGYKFRPMVLLSGDRRQYEVHYERFHEIEPCEDFVETTAVEEEEDHPLHNASGFL